MISRAYGRADRVDQVLHRRGAVAQAHLRRRDAEARVVGGDAQVAARWRCSGRRRGSSRGSSRPAACRSSAAALRALGDLLVALHRLGARALLLELRDVGAGDEGLVARAGEHDDAHLAGRRRSRSSTVGIASHMSTDTALRRAGLLKISQPTAPSLRAIDPRSRLRPTLCSRRPVDLLSGVARARCRISSVCSPSSGVARRHAAPACARASPPG